MNLLGLVGGGACGQRIELKAEELGLVMVIADRIAPTAGASLWRE
jgi:hypothetical protein